jgi:hypothetical protein
MWDNGLLPVPGPGTYDFPPKKVSPKPWPIFANKLVRDRVDEVDGAPVGLYDPDLPPDLKIPTEMRDRDNRPEMNWCDPRLAQLPSPAQYTPKKKEKTKGGLMNTVGHKRLHEVPDDHNGFSTPHSGFIKRTYSSRYYHVNSMVH